MRLPIPIATSLWILILVLASPVPAQLPEGPESVFPGALEWDAAVAADGSIAIVWTEGAEPDRRVIGRVYQADGTPLTAVFPVSSFDLRRQFSPKVARTADGRILVVWFDCPPSELSNGCVSTADHRLRFRRFATDGTPDGSERTVQSESTFDVFGSAVAVAPDGGFLIAWALTPNCEGVDPEETCRQSVAAQRYSADGLAAADPVLVNSFTRGDMFVEQVVRRSDGSWIVVWTSLMGEGDLHDVAARILNPDGTLQGGELQLNPMRGVPGAEEQGPQDRGRVAVFDDRSFVGVWNHTPRDPTGRLFDADGLPKGDHFPISSGGDTFDNPNPAVLVTPGGRFLVVWKESLAQGDGQESFDDEMWGRWFSAAGIPEGDRFRINARTEAIQVDPRVFPLPDGDVLVLWRRWFLGEQPDQVIGRRLSADCTAGPSTLCLQEGRFRVEVAWAAPQGNQGVGRPVPQTPDTGSFWFFQPSNLELMVKVLDGRDINDHFWVFFGALSNVEYTLMVSDTEANRQKLYFNPQGAQAGVADTIAFPE